MKRLLSIILAISMCTAVFSANASAADAEENDGVISYKITTDAIKSGAFEEVHNIPTNESGKLVFGTASLDATVFNVLANLQGNRSSKNALIQNAETAFITYRTLNYNMYKSGTPTSYTPLRTDKNGVTSDLEEENGEAKVYTMPGTLDLSYTAPYELMGRNYFDNNHGLVGKGVFETLKLFAKSGDTVTNNMETNIIVRRPGYIIRIKVEEGGVYNLKAYNNFTVGSDDNISYSYIKELGTGELYNVAIASKCDVYVVPVPEQGLEFEYNNSGKPQYVCIGDNRNNNWRNNAIKLTGTYSSYPGTEKLFENNIELAVGEYWVVFEVNKDTVDTTDYSDTTLYGTSYYQNFILSGIDLVPVVTEDEEYAKSFDAVEETYETHGKAIVNAYAYADNGEQIEALETSVEKTLGETYTYTAPEKEGKNFLYWAKGASKDRFIISYERELEYKPSEGQNHIIAVYEDKASAVPKAEFYNANGERLAVSESVLFPDLPSMAGYGKAEAWICYNNGETYTGNEGDIELAGTMIFVAKYGELLSVTVNGKSYTYGDAVELIAEDKYGLVFKGWKKNGEIVSVNKNYTFRAYENCDVEAIYADKSPNFSGKFIKIFMNTFTAGDNTAIMAEFIGITGAVEKGIIANGNKIPMKGDGSQFTVTADIDGTYEGYAIIKEDDSYTQIKDGEIILD